MIVLSIREVVLTRDELVRYLAKNVSDKTDIGKMTRHIEGAFVFQNDVGRPAYILEVDRGISPDAIAYLSECLDSMAVCACIIPVGMVRYAATVTPESMGVKNYKSEVYGWEKQEWADFPTVEDIEGDSE